MKFGPTIPMPKSPIERLACQFRNFLYLPDASSLYTLMGAIAANMIEGEPCWIMLVGPPSCGKSELLNSTVDVPRMLSCCSISGEAAFLSGTEERFRAKDATGGILRQVGDHGGIILNDFTSLLSSPKDRLMTIMGIFRECYGGRWVRQIGGEGGKLLQWTGKLGLFAGCTPKIDLHHALTSELGERWVYYRFDQLTDGWNEMMMSLSGERRKDWRDELRRLVRIFFEDCKLAFGKEQPAREFTDAERFRIYDLATLAVRCRSSVSRTEDYQREVLNPSRQEVIMRVGNALTQLLLGLCAIGVPPQDRWKILRKVALDSMPDLRRMIIETVSQEPISVKDLARKLKCGPNVTRRTVEDLEIHEVLRQSNEKVRFTDWMVKNYHKCEDTTQYPNIMQL